METATERARIAAAGSKPLLRVLAGEPVFPPPVWLMRQAGRYLPEYRALREAAGSFLGLCYDPEKAAEVTLQPVRRFGMHGAILFADILLVPDALGRGLAFREGEGPVLDPLGPDDAIPEGDPDQVVAHLAPVFETVRLVRRALPAETALIGFAGAPWTVATYMIEGGSSRDFARARAFAYRHPDRFQALMDMLVRVTVAYLDAQVRAGAEAVQLFDSWAGVLPEPQFRRWVTAPTRAIVAAMKARHPGVPVIGFAREAGAMVIDYAAETGVDAIGLDTAQPLARIRDAVPGHVALQGNLDPMLLLTGGAALAVEAERICRTLAGRAHVFNLGHGVVPPTPPEHVGQLVALLDGLAP